MPSRAAIQAIIAVAAVVWLVGLAVQGVDVEWSWMRWYSVAVAFVALLSVSFDRWLWRLPPVKWVVRRPDVAGTWKGWLRSEWVDAAGNRPAPIEVYLVLRQTFADVRVTVLTPESKSDSLTAKLDPDDLTPTLTYTYRNTPRLTHQARSRIHHGTVCLQVHGKPPECLEGSYWTDRTSQGEMEFRKRSRQRCSEFGQAQTAFAASADQPSEGA